MPSKCRPQRLPDNSSVLGLPGAETVGLAEKVEGVLAAVGGGESEEVGGLRTGGEVRLHRLQVALTLVTEQLGQKICHIVSSIFFFWYNLY